MLLLREPFWLLFLTAFIGLLFGRMKGRPGWGFLLGMFFGPLGLALTLLMPARRSPPFSGRQQPFSGGGPFSRADSRSGESNPGSGPACPRCAKSVGRSDKTCCHCGNVLMPIRYEVRGPGPA